MPSNDSVSYGIGAAVGIGYRIDYVSTQNEKLQVEMIFEGFLIFIAGCLAILLNPYDKKRQLTKTEGT